MSPTHKPAGYNTVSPYLIVNGAAGTIEFLIRAFGAQEIRRFPDESGRVMHSEVRLDDSVLMIADGVEAWPAIAAHVHLYVPDVDAAFARALAAGATSIQPPIRKQDEDKRGGVQDPGGTTWWIATREGG
jgi:PhnB protein